MNFCKKILCILLIFCMMLTMQPISIFAKSEDVNGKSIRYSVLILDTSGSMLGVPSDIQKEAAIKFCNSIFAAEGENYVAIVKLASKSSIGCEFTNNINVLTDYINKIPASGGTNINQALNIADELLNTVSDLDNKMIKNIILCSDGLPQNGETSLQGPYTEIDNSTYYHYSNSVFNTSTLLKEKYNIYTLGFFHSLDGSELKFGRKLMEDIQNTGYYEVTDVDKLEFSFGEIANNILNGNNLLDDLRRTYINQHKKYFHTSYSTDVIYTGLNNGLKSLMEDAADDYSNILYKQLNIVVSAFDDMKKMLGISSYIDINVYKGVSVSLKVPDLVLEDLGSSEYSVLLYELMANDKVYKGMKDVFKENYCYNIISYAKDISGRIDELIKNDNLERLTEAKQALVKVTETLATADIRSPEFAAAYVDLEFYQNNYLDKWKMKKFITENSGTFGDMTELISSVFNEINDVSRAYQYLCWATTYAEASTMFKDIIREIGERAESRYKQLYITNGVDRTNPYSKLYMYKGLAESAKSFINVMDSYVEDAHKTFASEILGKTEDSCVNLVLNAVQEKVTGKSNVLDLIIPGLGIFNDVLSGTKLFVDVCTSADEKYKSLVAVDSLKLIADLLVDMSKNCGIVMDAGVRVPIPNNNFDILSAEYEQALRFDELINMYKTAMILACEYGIEYEKLEMKSNAVFANLVPDMWYDAGETTGWQKQVSMSAGVITTLNCSKIILSNIKCHDGTLDPLISKVIDYPDSLKIVTIACPVDVQVLDSNGNQVAYLTENNVDVVSGYEPYFFTVRTNNDDYIKTAVIPENENYQLLIKGNNRGNMTVFIAQSKNNQIVEVETFANYPVTKNTVGHIDFSDKDKPLGNLIITAGEIVDNEELYTVKFNANSGTKLSQEKRRLSMGERIGTLPTVQRKNYIFKGWYTKKSGGKRVKSTTVLDFSTTLYAHWSKVIPPKKVKLLSLESTERGIITVTFKNVLEAAGYQIAYSTASDFTSSKVKKIFSNKANKARLKPGEIYYVKIRAYKTDSAGKRVYGTYSKKKKIKVME